MLTSRADRGRQSLVKCPPAVPRPARTEVQVLVQITVHTVEKPRPDTRTAVQRPVRLLTQTKCKAQRANRQDSGESEGTGTQRRHRGQTILVAVISRFFARTA